ncbi:MAG: hypothetical protein KGD73_10935 [Candidatus Lokiarchaeota archaeon]|nr:hypothetical protein [Candidatus Lokiarchaeota archaeon]
MDSKLYKKTYPFICSKCKTLINMNREYCESCGMKGTIVKASKEDYKNAKI